MDAAQRISKNVNYSYIPLPQPTQVVEQTWPANTNPLVHIRIMVFNHENYLRTCLDSILEQKTTFPIRILIHNDASTDGSAAILNEYSTKYPQLIHVYTQTENTYWISDFNEKKKRRATFDAWRIGKYEALCEGDDFWCDPTKLQQQVDWMETHEDYSGICHTTRVLNENGRTSNADDFWTNWEYDRDLDLSHIVQAKSPFHTSAFLFRSSILPSLAKVNLKTKSYDWVNFTICAIHGKIRYLHQPMSVYRVHIFGITTTMNHRAGLAIQLNRYHMWFVLKQHGIGAEQEAIFNKMLRHQRNFFLYHYNVNNWREAVDILSELYKQENLSTCFLFLRRYLFS